MGETRQSRVLGDGAWIRAFTWLLSLPRQVDVLVLGLAVAGLLFEGLLWGGRIVIVLVLERIGGLARSGLSCWSMSLLVPSAASISSSPVSSFSHDLSFSSELEDLSSSSELVDSFFSSESDDLSFSSADGG